MCTISIKIYWIKWENVFTFLEDKENDSHTIFSKNSDGTKCKSTDFFNCLDSNFTEIYLKNIAITLIGFFVFAERI